MTYESMNARLDQERADRLNLTNHAGWKDRDRISFEDHGLTHWIVIPLSLSLADKLRCVDIYLSGVEAGIKEGRYVLQGELLDLIGAARRD